jgi:hypothetical protein
MVALRDPPGWARTVPAIGTIGATSRLYPGAQEFGLAHPAITSLRRISAALAVALAASAASADSPFASSVISYSQGLGAGSYNQPASALGAPTRITGEALGFPGATSPFNPAFEEDELVTIGRGGHLTIAFDHDVTNDALNPYGIDLLIFGNSFFADAAFPSGVAGLFAGEGGTIEVSRNGNEWITVTGSGPGGSGQGADSGYPTLAFTDLLDPYSAIAGLAETDFTKPVDPLFNPAGLTFAEIVAGYNGSGGGLGIDIGAFGLDAIRFVRITSDANSTLTPEIDAFADVTAVPSPGAMALLLVSGCFMSRPRREKSAGYRG